ncbi:protein DJ-1 homolog D-like isoform X4 [Malus sylvestris]|uniref:protein DJ-1 homolog D-like isoform X4 n=1 Tax=Malus sylvestris TaxID=3752 RepID=UPI0021ACF2BA|nr:protein DJ-1 homolog D-like isoform X4 [Malus sylvestris]
MAAADSIRGRKCTGFPPVRPVLVATGAHWVEPEVMSSVVDGDIVSGVTYEGLRGNQLHPYAMGRRFKLQLVFLQKKPPSLGHWKWGTRV